MLLLSELKEVIVRQQEQIGSQQGLKRHILDELQIVNGFALVISGIRRCGKSTLLGQLIRQQKEEWLYLNFDTPRLYGFEFKDFRLLDQILGETRVITLFFDEIQVIDQWEIYVRGKLDEGYQVVVTGSNASMISSELGTKLTGRHITKELFPFSLAEFCQYKNIAPSPDAVHSYLEMGGMPQFVKTHEITILHTLIHDILYRDIAVRHNIRNDKPLRHLLMFLVGNAGNLVSANKLKAIIGVKSANTVQDYLSFFEAGYLIQLIPRFSYSYKSQLANPRKVYFIDNGMQAAVSPSFTPDWGRRLENMIFCELRRKNYDLFYFNENNAECDFVITHNNAVVGVIQVCVELNNDNRYREVEGVKEAMDFFQLQRGYIVTLKQHDTIMSDSKIIEVLPAHKLSELF